jgi:hypothetical protein
MPASQSSYTQSTHLTAHRQGQFLSPGRPGRIVRPSRPVHFARSRRITSNRDRTVLRPHLVVSVWFVGHRRPPCSYTQHTHPGVECQADSPGFVPRAVDSWPRDPCRGRRGRVSPAQAATVSHLAAWLPALVGLDLTPRGPPSRVGGLDPPKGSTHIPRRPQYFPGKCDNFRHCGMLRDSWKMLQWAAMGARATWGIMGS